MKARLVLCILNDSIRTLLLEEMALAQVEYLPSQIIFFRLQFSTFIHY